MKGDIKMENCCREATVRDYIERFGNTELCHDYEEEAKRVLELYDKEKLNLCEDYEQRIKMLEQHLKEKDIIISCLVKCLEATV